MKPKISIIIVSYNNADLLRKTILSLIEKITVPSIEIIVVDNASTENNVMILESEFPNIKLIKNDSNLGFGKACNLGAKIAAGLYLLFVNSDILLTGNPLPEMIRIYEENNKTGSVGVQLHNPDGTKQPSGFRFPGLFMRFLQLSGLKDLILRIFPSVRVNNDKIFEVPFVSGAFLLILKTLFDELGGFDERYFMYLEDADLCFQINKSGKKNYILNINNVIHLNENHENSSSAFVFYHLNKGQLLFYQKNFSKFKTIFLKNMSRIIITCKLCLLYLKKNSNTEIEKFKKVLSIYS